MKFSEAVQQHQEVRVLLSRYIVRETATSMGLFTVGRDISCPLGEWLHKNRNVHGVCDLPAFQALSLVHQSFHGVAYEVLRLAMVQKTEEATALLNGAYGVVEKELIEAILSMSDAQQD